jgi:hypothetical protein
LHLDRPAIVIASEAKQSRGTPGALWPLDRRVASLPRDDDSPQTQRVLRAGRLHFARRNETFRLAALKSLKSLGVANQPFRGFLCYQGLAAHFVSLRSREALARPASAPKPRAPRRGGRAGLPCFRPRRQSSGMRPSGAGGRARGPFGETVSIAKILSIGKVLSKIRPGLTKWVSGASSLPASLPECAGTSRVAPRWS